MQQSPLLNPRFSKTSRVAVVSEWAIAVLISLNLIWTSLNLGGVRANSMLISWVLTDSALMIFLLRTIWTDINAHWAGRYLMPFFVYASLNAILISPVPWLASRDLLHWTQTAVMFWLMLDGLRRDSTRTLVMLTIGSLSITALAMSCYQLAGHQSWLMLGRVQAAQYIGRASGFFGNPNTLAAFFIILIPPMLAWIWRHNASAVQRLGCGYFALTLIAGLVMTMSRGAILALVLALIAWPFFVREWNWGKRALTSASIALAALAIIATLSATIPSVRNRIEDFARDHGEKSRPILWQASLKMTASAPVFGTGAGSFNTLFEKYRPEGFRDEPQWTHNDYLNILSDYGIVGFVLLFGAVAIAVWRCNHGRLRRTKKIVSDDLLAASECNRAMGVGLLALALASVVDFHLHIPAIAMIAAVLSADVLKRHGALIKEERRRILETKQPCPTEGTEGNRFNTSPPFTPIVVLGFKLTKQTIIRLEIIRTSILIALLTIAIIAVSHIFRAEAKRTAGREKIDSLAHFLAGATDIERTTPHVLAREFVTYTEAEVLFTEAITLDSTNAQAWADRAYTLALQARLNPQNAILLGRAAEDSARLAIAQSDVVYEFWIRLGVALDLQGRTNEAGNAFAQAIELAPSNALAWYYQAYHYTLTPATHPLALRAAEIALRLDPGYTDADKLRDLLTSKR